METKKTNAKKEISRAYTRLSATKAGSRKGDTGCREYASAFFDGAITAATDAFEALKTAVERGIISMEQENAIRLLFAEESLNQ